MEAEYVQRKQPLSPKVDFLGGLVFQICSDMLWLRNFALILQSLVLHINVVWVIQFIVNLCLVRYNGLRVDESLCKIKSDVFYLGKVLCE